MRPATTTVHAGRPAREPDAPLNPPITMASTYLAGGDVEYGRYGNPTWTALEDAIGALEGGRALCFASGLAAVATVFDLVANDGLVVAPRHAYNGSLGQLADLESRGRLRTALVDVTDTEAVIAACEDAALVWLESPTNPALEIADLERIIPAAHAAGAHVVVDNTFATPLFQRPLELGADLVVHSATKYFAGHSDVQMGAIVAAADDDGRALHDVLKARRDLYGAVPGPFEAWLTLRGMRTLDVRVRRARDNALELVRRLGERAEVTEVRYPGFGAIVAAVFADEAVADALQHRTRIWAYATSLGGVESSLERRRRWRAEPATIPAGLVRLSVGIEDVEDLWEDLVQALGGRRTG